MPLALVIPPSTVTRGGTVSWGEILRSTSQESPAQHHDREGFPQRSGQGFGGTTGFASEMMLCERVTRFPRGPPD